MRYLTIILLFTGLFACKREFDPLYDYKDITNTANVKIVHSLSNAFATPTATAQSGLQVYYNNQKLTGTNINYGGVFPVLEYAKLPAGNISFKWVMPAGASNPETAMKDTTVTLQADQTYTLFLIDTLPDPHVMAVLEKPEDLKAVADSGKFFVRLVHLTTSAPGFDLIDSVKNSNTTLFTNVGYGTVSPYIQYNVGSAAKKFLLRNNGATTNLVTVDWTPVAGRVYTFYTMGIGGLTGARAPKMTFVTTRFQTMIY